MNDVVYISTPEGKTLALCLYRNGDWAVACGSIPDHVEDFDEEADGPPGPFSVTHVPSGAKAFTVGDLHRAMMLCDELPGALAGDDPVHPPSLERAREYRVEAERRVSARLVAAAQVLIAHEREWLAREAE